ncbi:zinc ribbon domain-containing protein [Egicoccus sp. AB-alg2]|uniref:zinc ribbon domain-containing protein n=1 Tax=Egicoccus sp. AB-alg2 TaxID=3242693 RepID=UPI00359DD841
MTSDAAATSQPRACQDCGTPATPGARFCRACGVALQDPEPAPPPARAPVEDDETTGELDRITRGSADVSPPVGALALRSCPNCGGPNSPRRELCGRCGADLDTGSVPPRADARALAFPGQPGSDDDEPRSWLGAGLAVLLLVVLVVAGLGLAGIGPFGNAEASVPSARFDEQTYTGPPERLPIAEIATRTTLEPQGGISYEASQMVDDDPGTAWNSDGRVDEVEDGVGERIELFLEEPAWVDRFVVRNGDQRDAETYAANARIQRAQVTMDGGVVLLINLLDEGLAPQAVELTEPVLTTGVSIEVLDTFPGDTHPDLAVSDLELQGWAAQGDDVQVARQRAQGRPATASPSS